MPLVSMPTLRPRPLRRRSAVRADRAQHSSRRGTGSIAHTDPSSATAWFWWCRRTTRYRPRASSGRASSAACPRQRGAGWWCSASSRRQPETGYGYIEVGAESGGMSSTCRASSKSRTLRPREAILLLETSTGTPVSSCFARAPCATPSSSIQPDIWQATEAALQGGDIGSVRPLHAARALRRHSVELDRLRHHGAGKRHRHGAGGFRWNDLGSWQSLLDVGPADKTGAMSSSATSSPSIARTPTCAATAACCRRSA
jgi:hypothetical protein